jgi:hypothetical protein
MRTGREMMFLTGAGLAATLVLASPGAAHAAASRQCTDPIQAERLMSDRVLAMFTDTTARALAFRSRGALEAVPAGDWEIISDPVLCDKIDQRIREWYGPITRAGFTGYSVHAYRVGPYFLAFVEWHRVLGMAGTGWAPLLVLSEDLDIMVGALV